MRTGSSAWAGGWAVAAMAAAACQPVPAPPSSGFGPWGAPERVTIQGYAGTAQQDPHITADGNTLLFDTHSDTPGSATHVHYAKAIDYKTFVYAGPVLGMQDGDPTLQGGPNTDNAGNIYWLTGRNPGHTIARGVLANGNVTAIQPVLGIDGSGLGHIGATISRDGGMLYFTDNTDTTSKMIAASRNPDGSFARLPSSDAILANVNAFPVVYGGGTSYDGLEIYFVGFTNGSDPSTEAIRMAARSSIADPFGVPVALTGDPRVVGIQEGACVSLDGHRFYFHKVIDANTAEIWVMTR